MKTLADRLKYAREIAGHSARALDDLAKLTPGHTAAIESGRRIDPSASTMTALAKALGVSLDWLVAGSGTPPKRLRPTGS